jgi:hypothetical protein
MLAATWLLLQAVCSLAFWIVLDVPRLVRLANNYRLVTGKVLSVQPMNHMSAVVRYQVADVTYERTFIGYGSHQGANATVFYYPGDPTVSYVQEPGTVLKSQLAFGAVAGFIISSVLTFSARRLIGGNARALPRSMSPRVTASLVSLGVVGGIIFGAKGGLIHGRAWFGGWLVLSGCLLLVIGAWRLPSDSGWSLFVRSRVFAVGMALALAGNLINLL